MREARSDAWWRGLSQEMQDQIAEWCRAPKTEESPGGLQHAREQLAADGIKVSLSQVSRFFASYRLGQAFTHAEGFAKDVQNTLKKEFPDATPEKLANAGQLAFTAMALASQDSAEFREMEKLRLKWETASTKGRIENKKLELAERRVSLLEENAARAKAQLEEVISKGGLSPETLAKIQESAKLL